MKNMRLDWLEMRYPEVEIHAVRKNGEGYCKVRRAKMSGAWDFLSLMDLRRKNVKTLKEK